MNLSGGQQWRRDTENRLMNPVGEGEDMMNWESTTEAYVLAYVK